MGKRRLFILYILCTVLLLTACSPSKFLQSDEQLLESVKVTSSDPSIKGNTLRNYVRQEPNARWFNVLKVPLGLYCLSGRDSTKGINRFFRHIGQAPVVYDSLLTERSRKNLELALQNRGYLQANVQAIAHKKAKRTKVEYHLRPGNVYRIQKINKTFDSPFIESIILADSSQSLLRVGNAFDVNTLENERKRITLLLQNKGFYKIHKEFVTYQLDSIEGEKGLDLTLRFAYAGNPADSALTYSQYRIRNIRINEDMDLGMKGKDSLDYRDLHFFYDNKLHLRPSAVYENVTLHPGNYYRELDVQHTNGNLDALQAVQYGLLRFSEADSALLDCDINLRTYKPHSISTELEGTNTAGDLGAAASVGYTNRNLFRGSEVFTFKVKGAFEAITGLEGYSDQNYVEVTGEASLKFPRLLAPFFSERVRQYSKINSEISVLYSSQNRPEFHRRVLTGTWSYRWNRHNGRLQNKFDLISLNYVFMPWISSTFQKEYLDSATSRNSILRYSYENLFIMKMGYSMILSSRGLNSAGSTYQTNAWQIHANIETAGNLLNAASHLFKGPKDDQGQYTLFNIAYAQYVKADFDFAKSFLINERNSIAFRFSGGLVIPYGNSSVVPYEKRYFAGGANSVRGWSVRGLGPAGFKGADGKIDFINQTGNIKLLASLEYRTYLFWKLHGALFIDAGNVWTSRNYSEQQGGKFYFDKFYKQIAASYGLGIRLNFDYFILRFDMAMKAVNPSYTTTKEHYPFVHPDFGRDFAFHFAVGLPF